MIKKKKKKKTPAHSASLPINPHRHLSFHSLTTVVQPKNRSIVTVRKSKLRHVMSSVRLAVCVETCQTKCIWFLYASSIWRLFGDVSDRLLQQKISTCMMVRKLINTQNFYFICKNIPSLLSSSFVETDIHGGNGSFLGYLTCYIVELLIWIIHSNKISSN